MPIFVVAKSSENWETDKNTLKSVAIAYELTFYLFQKE